jgi:DNA helicase-2/ATP-dependent DNA helicase PcrA
MLHGQTRYNIASRFLAEVPRELLEWLSPPRRRGFDIDRSEWGNSAPTVANSQVTQPGPSWRVGQSVKHSKFGLGVIIDAEGRGNDARVQVNFRDAGVKWLALEYANLQPA